MSYNTNNQVNLGLILCILLQSVRNDSYDHHAAIYFLLQDRLASSSSSRSSSLSPNRSQQQQQQPQQPQQQPSHHSHQQQNLRRRPSSIAEQGQVRIVTENLLSLRESNNTDPQFAVTPQQLLQQQQQYQQHQQQMLHLNLQQPLWQSPAVSKVEETCYQTASGMMASDFSCLTCGGQILENTTSTTTCVKCARLRIRRRNFAHQVPEQGRPIQFQQQQQQQQQQHQQMIHQQQQMLQHHFEMLTTSNSEDSERGPHGRHDSRDSGVSSGSSQVHVFGKFFFKSVM